MRIYGYRFTRGGGVAGAERSSDPVDRTAAEAAGWPIDSPTRLLPADVFERSAAAASALDEDSVLGAFVAGLGSAPRGRQTLISFAWARHLDASRPADGGLAECGLAPSPRDGGAFTVDETEVLLRIALGWAWNEQPHRYLADLESAATEGLPTPTDEDRDRLRLLLDVIASQPDGTRASELEKAVARAKVVPGTDKYQRYGILIGLAEFGALPSSLDPSWDRFVSRSEIAAAWSGGPRSDITPPLSGWRGGLEERRAERLRTV